jgi:hypothetical protein
MAASKERRVRVEGCVEERRHDAVLVIERATTRDDPLHAARSVEQFHE